MTHHPIRTLPDGTRVYSNGTRYKPKAPQARKYAVRQPDDPDAVRYYGDWYLPLAVLPDTDRVMPATRPDEVAYEHRAKPRPCRCEVCRRPEVEHLKDRWVRDNLLRSAASRRRP